MAPIRVYFFISKILHAWDTCCSPSGCADTPVSGLEGGNFCPAESGSSGRNPATTENCQGGEQAGDGDRNNLTRQGQIKTAQMQKQHVPKSANVSVMTGGKWENIPFLIFSELTLWRGYISLSLLPRRASAAHCGRGWLRRTWAPCTECAGCSGVCGPSRPPGVRWPPFVPLDKNCTQTHLLLGA